MSPNAELENFNLKGHLFDILRTALTSWSIHLSFFLKVNILTQMRVRIRRAHDSSIGLMSYLIVKYLSTFYLHVSSNMGNSKSIKKCITHDGILYQALQPIADSEPCYSDKRLVAISAGNHELAASIITLSMFWILEFRRSWQAEPVW